MMNVLVNDLPTYMYNVEVITINIAHVRTHSYNNLIQIVTLTITQV